MESYYLLDDSAEILTTPEGDQLIYEPEVVEEPTETFSIRFIYRKNG